jgi:hypothetical protein
MQRQKNKLMKKLSLLGASLLLMVLVVSTATISKKILRKTIGGKGYDAANAIIPTRDGNFILMGRSDSYGAGDMNMNVVKVDKLGNTLWDKNYGADENEEAFAGVETTDKGFIFVGYSDSYGAGPDMKDVWVVKTDAAGQKVWDKTFGTRESIDEARAIIKTDGGYLIAANTLPIHTGKSDILLIKISESGEKIWEKRFGGSTSEQVHAIVETPTGFALAGHIDSEGAGKWDMLVISVDKNGEKIWEQRYGGGDNEMGNAIAVFPNGDLAVAGYSYTFAQGSHDAWVLRISKEGKKLWDKSFGGLSTDEFFGVVINSKEEIILAGYTDIYEGDAYGNNKSILSNEVFVVKLDGKGTKLWEKTHGGKGMQVVKGIAVQGAEYGVCGYTDENFDTNNADMLFLQLDESGNLR